MKTSFLAAILHSQLLLALLGTPESPPEKMINPGEKISIPCSLSTPGGSVQWVQNGHLVTLDNTDSQRRFWNILPDGTAALTILGVTRKDEGSWECWELGEDGKVKRMTKVLLLIVTSAPEDPFLELEGRKLAHQATITVHENNMVSIHCVVSRAVPPVRLVHWLLDSNEVSEASQMFVEFTDDAYDSRSVLTLNLTRALNRRELICQVHHVTWMHPATVSASLNVLYPPSFSISREPGFGYPVVEGSSVSLKCEVDANPTSSSVWLRDDGEQTVQPSKNGVLNFTAISRSHTGWYRCSTDHSFGSFASFGYFLNVRERPAVMPADDAPSGREVNGAMQLDCQNNGRPEAEALNRTLMVIAGRAAFLSVRFCAHPKPSRSIWIVGRRAIQPGQSVPRYIAHNYTEGETPQCYMATLEIASVQPDDAGEVIFVVKNANGMDDAVMLLNVTQASFSVSELAGRARDTADQASLVVLILACLASCLS